jgi:hypothetical protein
MNAGRKKGLAGFEEREEDEKENGKEGRADRRIDRKKHNDSKRGSHERNEMK